MNRPSKAQLKTAGLRVQALETELHTCQTVAEDACVRKALDEATRHYVTLQAQYMGL